MPRCQGIRLSDEEVHKIMTLLKTTDLSMVDIAERMNCTRGSVARINKGYEVRDYSGRRSSWTLAAQTVG